jgi:hypothetical protein
MADCPDGEADEPEAQAEADRARQRAVDDGDARGAPPSRIGSVSARWTGTVKPGTSPMSSAPPSDSAPPPNEKNDRKKLDAAKAIDRPNTIWISRRKPPDVSPKASVRPVTMMMITATILATGPSIDSRIDCSGASHGMDEPPAWAAGASGQR